MAAVGELYSLGVVARMRFLSVILLIVLFAGCKPRDPFEGAHCIVRLKMIDGSKETWMLEHHKTTNDVVTWDDIRPYLSREGAIPVCPRGGTYTLGRLRELPRCSVPEHTL